MPCSVRWSGTLDLLNNVELEQSRKSGEQKFARCVRQHPFRTHRKKCKRIVGDDAANLVFLQHTVRARSLMAIGY